MGNSEIVAISNRYKDTLDDLINSSDSESLDWLGLINKRSCNVSMSESSSADFLEGNCLDKNLSDKSSRLASKIQDLQVRQRRIIVPQTGYEKSKRGGENRRGNKINLVIRGSTGTETSVYHYVIDRY